MSVRIRVLAAGAAVAALLAAPSVSQAFSLTTRLGAPAWMRAPAATVPDPHPLTGEASNFRIAANLPLDNTGGNVAASDIEMHGNHAFIGSYTEGMVIADISDPTRPRRAGVFACGGGSQYDVQLSDDGNLAVLSTDSTGASCLTPGDSGSMIIDTTDKANPVMVGFIPIAVGTHTHTLDDRILYVNNYPRSYSRLEIFDLSTPSAPAKIGELSFGGEDSIHDSFVDHRPDGRTFLYAASIGYTDVIDVTDPARPMLKQRLADPAVSISHQAEPNHRRDTLLVTDEFQGGADASVCGKVPVLGDVPAGGLPETGQPADTGAVHFYRLAADGTLVNNGTGSGKIGTYNLPVALNPTGGCTVHVLWQAPAENRFTAAWYGRGTHVVDFTDPAGARNVGYAIPDGADTWAAKPHRVGGKAYVFTGDIVRGMDVLEYTGDGWPQTAPPQEQQRAAYRRPGSAPPRGGTSVPTTPRPPSTAGPGSSPRALGGARFRYSLRMPGARRSVRTATLSFLDAKGAPLAKLRYRVRGGTRRVLRARVGAVVGTYRYVVRIGDRGRILKRGRIRVRAGARGFPRVPADRTLVCRIG